MISTLKIDRWYFGTHTPLCTESFVSPLTKTGITISRERDTRVINNRRASKQWALLEDDSRRTQETSSVYKRAPSS